MEKKNEKKLTPIREFKNLAVAIGSAMKDLCEDRIERGVALRELLNANKQQPTAPCCSDEDSHISETETSA